MDDLVVVVDELREAEHVTVEVDESIHVAEPDVADTVVDLEQVLSGRRGRRLGHLVVARREGAVVVGAIHERVNHLAVGVDGAAPQGALLALDLGRLERRDGPARGRLTPRRVDVVHGEGDVLHAVSVLRHVLRDLALVAERGGEDEADVVLHHHEAGPIANARLEARVGHRREAPERAVVVRRLLRVADPELNVVDALERQEILRLRRRIGVDDGAGLVRRAARERIGHGSNEFTAGPVPSQPAVPASSATAIIRSMARSSSSSGR